MTATCTVRVLLPAQLRRLARVDGELTVPVAGPPVSLGAVLDAVERRHPELCGTIRDRGSGRRRPYLRYFACEEDLSHSPAGAALPPAVARGDEPLLVVGAMAGG
ncbi:MoaD/ThiS family protein [Pseudonocardia kongjuensis]|uniref:MoaD/ThiS family protein n=1 Tax=Pseudonocardia kongjuensis TaxID=102227 RepID=A0ABN1Y1B9_9PSEU